MSRSYRSSGRSSGGCSLLALGCGSQLFFAALYVFFSTIATDYTFFQVFGVDLPTWAAVIIGFIVGSITVPVSIILFILQLAGVHLPFLPLG